MEGPMTKRIALLAAKVFSLGCAVPAAAQPAEKAVPEQLQVTIDPQQTGAPISKYLYGGFIEHGGTLMYRSLCSEMLDDRKFYFPITSKDAGPFAQGLPSTKTNPRRR